MPEKSRLIPGGMRHDERAEQIESIKAAITARYRGRIKSASTRPDRRALKAQRDAEIAAETEVLRREAEEDTPDCV